jgi:hypothetical protein
MYAGSKSLNIFVPITYVQEYPWNYQLWDYKRKIFSVSLISLREERGRGAQRPGFGIVMSLKRWVRAALGRVVWPHP